MSTLERVELECFGGPLDGATMRIEPTRVFMLETHMMRDDKRREIERVIYALEATDRGRFRLKYLSTHYEPIA